MEDKMFRKSVRDMESDIQEIIRCTVCLDNGNDGEIKFTPSKQGRFCRCDKPSLFTGG